MHHESIQPGEPAHLPESTDLITGLAALFEHQPTSALLPDEYELLPLIQPQEVCQCMGRQALESFLNGAPEPHSRLKGGGILQQRLLSIALLPACAPAPFSPGIKAHVKS